MNGNLRGFMVLGRSNLHHDQQLMLQQPSGTFTRHHGSDEVINKVKTDGSIGNLSCCWKVTMNGKTFWEGRLVYEKIKKQGTLLNLFFAFVIEILLHGILFSSLFFLSMSLLCLCKECAGETGLYIFNSVFFNPQATDSFRIKSISETLASCCDLSRIMEDNAIEHKQ